MRYRDERAELYHVDHRALAGQLAAEGRAVDAVIVDAPYSAKTHSGHADGLCDGMRRDISYAAWTGPDVTVFMATWAPVCSGWFVSITDHVLAPEWTLAMELQGLYAFAPIPFVARGSRVRLQGDGPSCWTTWIVVARPRNSEFVKWGTLPGAYVLPPGRSECQPVVGGKPSWLMRELVSDYTRPGDLVCDPCMGAGTTGVGALQVGRRFIGGDINRAHVDLAVPRIKGAREQLSMGLDL